MVFKTIVMSKAILILLLTTFSFGPIYSQSDSFPKYKSKFVDVNGIKTHYLDFGGNGLPLILVHSEAWDAFTYKDFGPLLTDNNQVIAVTRPGYGDSGTGSYKVESQGDHLIAFADSLGIEKAVFIGNSSVTKELTYLAENYPARLAGIVYLSGPAVPWLDVSNSDPYKAFEMYGRASPVANSDKNDREAITLARQTYRPKHFTSDSVNIEVPALVFSAKDGRQGHEEGVAALVFAGSRLMEDLINDFPPSPMRDNLIRRMNNPIYRKEKMNEVQDSIAREYFLRLSSDTVLQRKVYNFHMDTIYQATIKAQDKFLNAYGDNLHLLKLNVPQIIGYEYRDTPELIIDHIKNFLNQLEME